MTDARKPPRAGAGGDWRPLALILAVQLYAVWANWAFYPTTDRPGLVCEIAPTGHWYCDPEIFREHEGAPRPRW